MLKFPLKLMPLIISTSCTLPTSISLFVLAYAEHGVGDGFSSKLIHSLSMWSWKNPSIFLSLCFDDGKMGTKFPSYLAGLFNIQMGKWMSKSLPKPPAMCVSLVCQSDIYMLSSIPQIYIMCFSVCQTLRRRYSSKAKPKQRNTQSFMELKSCRNGTLVMKHDSHF